MTFQASVDYSTVAKKKVFIKDLYPSLNDDDFADDPYVFRDDKTGLLYELRDDIDFEHSIDQTYDRFYAVMDIIDRNLTVLTKQEACYHILNKDIPSFKRKLIKALNSSKLSKHTYSTTRVGNCTNGGLSLSDIIMRLESMLIITTNAQERGLDVFWA